MNKTIPCDRVLKCEKCYKIFTSITDLRRHNERKTPCDLPLKSNLNKKKTKLEMKSELEILKERNIQAQNETSSKLLELQLMKEQS